MKNGMDAFMGKMSNQSTGLRRMFALLLLAVFLFTGTCPQLQAKAVSDEGYAASQIYVKLPGDTAYQAPVNGGNMEIPVGTTIELLARLTDPYVVNGEVVNDDACVTGFWHGNNVDIDTHWEQIDNTNDWIGTATYTITGSEDIYLGYTTQEGNHQVFDGCDPWHRSIKVVATSPYDLNAIYYRVNSSDDSAYVKNTTDWGSELQLQPGDVIDVLAVLESPYGTPGNDFAAGWQEPFATTSDSGWVRYFDNYYIRKISCTIQDESTPGQVRSISLHRDPLDWGNRLSTLLIRIFPVKIRIHEENDSVENASSSANPYRIKVGETLSLSASFTTRGDQQASVYDNDYADKHVIDRIGTSEWEGNTLNFQFVAANPGTCRIVVTMGSPWAPAPNVLDTLYVEVYDEDAYEPGTLYYRVNSNDDSAYIKNETGWNSGVQLHSGDIIDVLAVVENYGTPYFTIDRSWGEPFEKLSETGWENWEGYTDRYYIKKASFQATDVLEAQTNQSIKLSTSNDPFGPHVLMIDVLPRENLMRVNDIVIGDKEYDNVPIDVATRMFNGINSGFNSATNRYTVFVGDTLTLTAAAEDGYELVYVGYGSTDVMRNVGGAASRSAELTASFLGLTEGDCEIRLQNEDGDVAETFFVRVRNPIFVNTAIGEYRKDAVHEYVFTALKWLYDAHPELFISDPDGRPIYVRNLDTPGIYTDDQCRYWVFQNDTLTLSTWVSEAKFNDRFVYDNGIETVGDAAVEDLGNGFYRITQEFKVTATAGSYLSIRFGNTAFYIVVKDSSHAGFANHFDIEVADNGTYTITETVKTPYGERTSVVVYKVYINGVNGCVVYDADGEIVTELESWEYWNRSDEEFVDETQFEFTSAYRTNKEGHLVGYDDVELDEAEVRKGNIAPAVMERDVVPDQIDKVVFDVNLYLIPQMRTTTRYDKQGEVLSIMSTTQFKKPYEERSHIMIEMGEQEKKDAINKCPQGNGYDFTSNGFMDISETVGDLMVSKVVDGEPTEVPFGFTITLSGTYVEDGETKNADQLSGIFGIGDTAVEFDNGVASFTLKHGESKMAEGLPAGLTYVVSETDSLGYVVNWSGDGELSEEGYTGQIKVSNTVIAECTNSLPDKGDLTVSKIVTGSGDTEREFNFTLILSDPEVNGVYGDMTFTNGTAVFTLKHGESKQAVGLLAGTTYTVIEEAVEGYTTTATGASGTIEKDGNAKAEFVNHMEAEIPEIPVTGDSDLIATWFGAMALSLAAVLVMLLADRKLKQSR